MIAIGIRTQELSHDHRTDWLSIVSPHWSQLFFHCMPRTLHHFAASLPTNLLGISLVCSKLNFIGSSFRKLEQKKREQSEYPTCVYQKKPSKKRVGSYKQCITTWLRSHQSVKFTGLYFNKCLVFRRCRKEIWCRF